MNDNKIDKAWGPIFDLLDIPSGTEKWFPLPSNPPKVLVLCRGGNCRSVAAAFILKYKYDMDVLSASIEKNTEETLDILANSWADYIIIMDKKQCLKLPACWATIPYFVCDIGDDIWANPFDFDLLLKVHEALLECFKQTNLELKARQE